MTGTDTTDTTKTTKTTLVLSWLGVLWQLLEGGLTIDELDGALFYFGCTREHAFDAESDELSVPFAKHPDRGRQIYDQLMAVVTEAEVDGRVIWRESGKVGTWEQLNELLRRRDLPVIGATTEAGPYTLPAMHAAVREEGLPYRVVSYGFLR